ncbi:hypothetical protein BsIDN1_23730 [Bacillus safensis]|uniref:histidine kinase n=1 Tax=Bacillus safensis TaxID=561879 RepID=A0A5S9M7D2_BACIA|nr:hypothetical protein BsIDN1_23730 [Bacillus safensis]
MDEARNSETGGTGLGLSIAKQIAEEHEAELKVDSRIGEGTAMTILFFRNKWVFSHQFLISSL